jgi:hypothetical protein
LTPKVPVLYVTGALSVLVLQVLFRPVQMRGLLVYTRTIDTLLHSATRSSS